MLLLRAEGRWVRVACRYFHAFHQIPDQWKPDALSQIQLLARLTNLPHARYIGEDEE